MQKNNFCIHSFEGARADFLGAILTNSFKERNNGAVHFSQNYLKIHENFATNIERKLKEYIYIRIDDNKSTNNLMQIVFNQLLKNPVEYMVNGYIDNFYVRTKDWVYNRREILNFNDYDYWIDFSYLNDIDFLKDLYIHIHCQDMPDNIERSAQENIQKQVNWKSVKELETLALLVDFEYKFNLFNWNKKFDVHEFMVHNNPSSLLKLSNYSLVPFEL